MEKVGRLIGKVCNALDIVGRWALFALMTLISVNIVLRIIGIPYTGTHEWIQFLLATAVGFTIANCAMQKRHVVVSILSDKFPPRIQAICDIFANLLVLAFVSVAGYMTVLHGLSSRASNLVGMVSKVPFYPFMFIVALGFFAYTIVAIYNIMEAVKQSTERSVPR